MGLPALSRVALRTPANAPKRKIRLLWDGAVAINSATELNASFYAQTITGNDAAGNDIVTTLRNFFGATAYYVIQHLRDAAIPGADAAARIAALPAYSEALLQDSTDGTPGSKQIFINVKQRSSGNPQAPLMILRPSVGLVPLSTDIERAYYRLRINIDPNITTNLSTNEYYTVEELKSGGWGGAVSVGDFRIIIRIVKGAGGLYWEFDIDNTANGNVAIPSVAAEFAANGGVRTIYQTARTADGTVSPGWNTLELRIIRPASRADIITGDCWAAVTPDGGDRLAIGRHQGGIQMGTEDLPFTRIILVNPYSSGTAPYVITCGPIEIWEDPNYNPFF